MRFVDRRWPDGLARGIETGRPISAKQHWTDRVTLEIDALVSRRDRGEVREATYYGVTSCLEADDYGFAGSAPNSATHDA